MFPNQIFLNGTKVEHSKKLGRQRVQIPAQAFIGFVALEPISSQSCDLTSGWLCYSQTPQENRSSVNPLACYQWGFWPIAVSQHLKQSLACGRYLVNIY